jgi:phosphatidylinositol alpha 1,6-mannosyltransferase
MRAYPCGNRAPGRSTVGHFSRSSRPRYGLVARRPPFRRAAGRSSTVRLALFTDTYLPQVNGVSRTLARLVEYAWARGHDVALVSPRVTDGPAEGVGLHVQLPGLALFVYPELRVARPPLGPEWARIERFTPDLVHCATEGPVGWAGRNWALRNGVPLVTSFHTNIPAYLHGYGLGHLHGFAWWLLRRFHAPARRTFCPSRHTIALVHANGFGAPLRLWSRGVDSEAFSPAHRREATRAQLAPGAERILLYVGRLAPEKRLGFLEEAWRRIRDQAPEAVLVLVGDGPARSELEAKVHPGLRLTGYLTGEALARAYASADVFVFPSDTETFGNVVAEAMASGLPVVAVHAGGVTDLVRDGETGLVVPPNDPAALSAALLRMLSDDAMRTEMGKRARSEAQQRRWERVFDDLFDDYEDALVNPRATRGTRESLSPR